MGFRQAQKKLSLIDLSIGENRLPLEQFDPTAVLSEMEVPSLNFKTVSVSVEKDTVSTVNGAKNSMPIAILIGDETQRDILSKIFHAPKHPADFADDDGKSFYCRSAGGEYFNIATPYATGPAQEVAYGVKAPFTKIFGATLGTSRFCIYRQIYCDDRHVKRFEPDTFPTFDAEKLSPAQIERIEKLYDEYLADIERNTHSNFATGSVYQRSGTKIYKIVRSKPLADAPNDVIGELYGLTTEQIDFLKNFESESRLGD